MGHRSGRGPRERRTRVGSPRAAVALLTRLPVGGRGEGLDPSRAAGWFPAVGLIVAAAGVAVRAGLEPLLGAPTATVAAVIMAIVVTGALHEDGLADLADGVWGGQTPERRREIMRDSRLGTYGTLAVVGDLLLRVALLGSVGLDGFARAVVTGEVLGRLAPVLLVAWLPPARPDGQGASVLPPGVAGWSIAGVTAVVVAAVATGVRGPVLLVAAGMGAWVVGHVARTRLGGTTGDVLGGAVCVCRLAVIATVVGFERAGVW